MSATKNRCSWPQTELDIEYHDTEWGVPVHDGGSPLTGKRRSLGEIPARTPESDALSKDLKKRGFSFVGSTICYAFMQAVGMVNDHVVTCFRYNEVRALGQHQS